MERKEEKKSLLIQSIKNKNKGTFALDKMYEYQQYHGIRRETPYVLRGSVIGCQYGTRLSKLDMKLDYGVYKGDLPVMTCADYKPENIPGFGSCLCTEKKYAGCVPMNPEVHPDGEKAVKLPENEYAHICIPRIKSGWKQAEERTMIYTGEEGYVPALTDEAVLVCQYGGLISVKSVPHKNVAVKKPGKKGIITLQMMSDFNWAVTLKELTTINNMLIHYNITNMASIRLFMATCGHESGKGNITLEKLNKDGTVAGKEYKPHERGAGYIQITKEGTHIEFLKTVENPQNAESIKKAIKEKRTAKYIAKHFPWEASGWFWSKVHKTKQGPLNKYIEEWGETMNIFLLTQYWANSWPEELSQENAVDIRDKNKWEIIDGMLYLENKRICREPKNWEDRKKNYHEAQKIFR